MKDSAKIGFKEHIREMIRDHLNRKPTAHLILVQQRFSLNQKRLIKEVCQDMGLPLIAIKRSGHGYTEIRFYNPYIKEEGE